MSSKYFAYQCLYCGVITVVTSTPNCPECGHEMVNVGRYVEYNPVSKKLLKLTKKKGCPANNNACMYLDGKCTYGNPRLHTTNEGRVTCSSYKAMFDGDRVC